MIRTFKTIEEYNVFTNNGQNLVSGDLYWIDGIGCYFLTNNIDGELKRYDALDEIPPEYIIPTGNVEITANGENINVHDYATASVNVQPDLTTETITENGTYSPQNHDGFSSVTVNVQPDLITETITENGTYSPQNHDGFSSVTVNVASGGGNEDLIDLIEGDITTLNIPQGTTSIYQYCFEFLTSLTSVTIPNSVTSIGNSAFNSCYGLTNINIPDSITEIGQKAFNYCRSLTSLVIPNSVTTINPQTFQSCSSLTSITFEATTPPTLTNTNAFTITNNCAIYVPAESVEAYKTATNWSSLASRIQAIPT